MALSGEVYTLAAVREKPRVSEKQAFRSYLGHPDLVSGGVVVAFALIALYDAWRLPFGSVRAPDAGFFPLSLSALLLLFGAGIVVGAFLNPAERAQFSARSWQVAIAAAAFILYALVLNKAGFVLATTGIMLLVMRGLGRMSWKQALLIAVPAVVLSYAAFVELGVPLPRGPLPF
jgi:hypothetical protein